jgi:hypothetical protein
LASPIIGHRALVEEGADVARIGRLGVPDGALQARVLLQALGVLLEPVGRPAQLLLGRVARHQPLDHEPHGAGQAPLLLPHLAQ